MVNAYVFSSLEDDQSSSDFNYSVEFVIVDKLWDRNHINKNLNVTNLHVYYFTFYYYVKKATDSLQWAFIFIGDPRHLWDIYEEKKLIFFFGNPSKRRLISNSIA